MNKQILSLISAGLMLGSASQINAMMIGDWDEISSYVNEYAEIALRQSNGSIGQYVERSDGQWVTINTVLEKRDQSVGIRIYYTGGRELAFIPAIEGTQNETVNDYLTRLSAQRFQLLAYYCAIENLDRIPSNANEYAELALLLRKGVGSRTIKRPNGQLGIICTVLVKKDEIFGIRISNADGSELAFAHAIEPTLNETINNYLTRLLGQRSELLAYYVAIEESGVDLPDVKVAK